MIRSLEASAGGMNRFMFRSTLFTLLLFIPLSSPRAQVNIENIRETDAKKGLSTAIKLDLANRSGNVDITTLGVDARVDFVQQKTRSFLLGRGDFGWLHGNRFSNGGLLHIRHTRFLSAFISMEAFGQIDYDKTRLLDFRSLVGVGPRFSIYKGKNLRAVWGTSYMLEHERYGLPAGARHAPEETVHRWSNYLNITAAAAEILDISWIMYAQPRFSDFADIRLLSEATLSFRINRYLSLTDTFRLRYDAEPPDGIENLDTALLTGLQAHF